MKIVLSPYQDPKNGDLRPNLEGQLLVYGVLVDDKDRPIAMSYIDKKDESGKTYRGLCPEHSQIVQAARKFCAGEFKCQIELKMQNSFVKHFKDENTGKEFNFSMNGRLVLLADVKQDEGAVTFKPIGVRVANTKATFLSKWEESSWGKKPPARFTVGDFENGIREEQPKQKRRVNGS
jgi:hypothetical protein